MEGNLILLLIPPLLGIILHRVTRTTTTLLHHQQLLFYSQRGGLLFSTGRLIVAEPVCVLSWRPVWRLCVAAGLWNYVFLDKSQESWRAAYSLGVINWGGRNRLAFLLRRSKRVLSADMRDGLWLRLRLNLFISLV